MGDIIPQSESPFKDWASNIKSEITKQAAVLKLTTEFVAEVSASADNVNNASNDAIQAKNESDMKKDIRDIVFADEKQKFRMYANILKTNPNYTAGIGQALGIISTPDAPINTTTFKSTIVVKGGHGFVSIKFTKKGVEGVNIYCRLKGETNWTLVTMAIHSPYNDHRMLADPTKPENREYMVVGVLGDVEIGVPSDIASIVFAG